MSKHNEGLASPAPYASYLATMRDPFIGARRRALWRSRFVQSLGAGGKGKALAVETARSDFVRLKRVPDEYPIELVFDGAE